MKKTLRRIVLVILGGLLINGYALAQESDFSQIGKATQELTHEGLAAAHESLAINQKVMVINEKNGKVVEVTIIEAVQSEANRTDRIIDLSADAWEALDLTEDNQVRLYLPPSEPVNVAVAGVLPPSEPELPSEPEPALTVQSEIEPVPAPRLEPPSEPEPALIVQSESEPAPAPQPAPAPRPAPAPAPQPAPAPRPAPVPTPQPAPAPRPAPAPVQRPAPAPTPRPAPAPAPRPAPAPAPIQRPCPEPAVQLPHSSFTGNVEIIPSLPDPRSGKIYRLQIGSFSVPGNADRLARLVQNAGFIVIREPYGSLHRVLVLGIPAVDVAVTARKMGTLGIRQVWVRE